MTSVLEHLTRNPNNHILCRGDALSKETEHPWVFSYITWTDIGCYDGNIFSKCLLSVSAVVNLGKSLTFLGLSLPVYKMGGINNRSLLGLPWRLNELTCNQRGLFSERAIEMGTAGFGSQSNTTACINECKAAPGLLLPALCFPSHNPTQVPSLIASVFYGPA